MSMWLVESIVLRSGSFVVVVVGLVTCGRNCNYCDQLHYRHYTHISSESKSNQMNGQHERRCGYGSQANRWLTHSGGEETRRRDKHILLLAF